MTVPSTKPGDGGAILVAGATSGAGKSTVAAALCRALARTGRSVAPFKAQNMSNHAAVTADGGEIGRAQAMQAAAAGVEPERRMNPVLLKPNPDGRSHVVVLGDERQTTDAASYGATTDGLKPLVLDAMNSLRRDHDWVVAEGAGGAAEINLFDRDLVNLPLAHAASIPAIVVVDIDRGGAFAAAHGTIDLLPPDLRATVAGVVFNQFRGDSTLLVDGIRQIEKRTGVPVLGVLPHLGLEPMLGVEDSLDLDADLEVMQDNASEAGTSLSCSDKPVRVAVIRFPTLANPSDFDPLVVEPDVTLRWVRRPDELVDADLIVLPGSRATVRDLAWLRRSGLADAVISIARRGTTRIVGLCAGYQMLGRTIDDPVESGDGHVDGLGLLDVHTKFACPKIVRLSTGSADGVAIGGYQIRFGRPEPIATDRQTTPWLVVDGDAEGSTDPSGRVSGSSLHGLFDGDAFRSTLLAEAAGQRNRRFQPSPRPFTAMIERQHDRLADWLEANVGLDPLLDIARTAGAPGQGPGW